MEASNSQAPRCCGCSGIYERKYELDSLANPLHLAAQYYAASQDMTPFQDDKWLSAVELTLSTMVGERATASVACRRRCSLGWAFAPTVPAAVLSAEQQKSSAEEHEEYGGPVYTFQRSATQPTDTLNHGVGWPAARTGMIKSAFRGSDDACSERSTAHSPCTALAAAP